MRSGSVLAGRVALALAVLVAGAAGHGAEPRIVKISAKRFSFTPSEVRVKRGETVVLELASEDRVHGFNLPAFKIRKDIVPKEVTRVTLTPDKEGTFPFHCDVFCGDGHEDMTGALVVTATSPSLRARADVP
ncbi:MAG: cupredoxin domain-containing protein [Thermoanaerobaculia bacterium]